MPRMTASKRRSRCGALIVRENEQQRGWRPLQCRVRWAEASFEDNLITFPKLPGVQRGSLTLQVDRLAARAEANHVAKATESFPSTRFLERTPQRPTRLVMLQAGSSIAIVDRYSRSSLTPYHQMVNVHSFA